MGGEGRAENGREGRSGSKVLSLAGCYCNLLVQPPTLAWSLWIPIVAAVLLWTSVPSVFFPCSVIQLTAVPPTRKREEEEDSHSS